MDNGILLGLIITQIWNFHEPFRIAERNRPTNMDSFDSSIYFKTDIVLKI